MSFGCGDVTAATRLGRGADAFGHVAAGGATVAAALLRALVAADLNGALEVDLHRVGEFEGLEVGVGQDRSGGPKVFDFGETGHEFGSGYATALIDQLNGRPFAVVGHAVADQHVEFTVVVLNGQDHRHRLTDFHDAAHFRSPRTFAHLAAARRKFN